jgi:hypothetical protein
MCKNFTAWIFAHDSMKGLNICPEEPQMRFISDIPLSRLFMQSSQPLIGGLLSKFLNMVRS